MVKEALENVEEGIRVGDELIKDVKYADDQGMVANTEAGLQSLMDSLNTTAVVFLYTMLCCKSTNERFYLLMVHSRLTLI